MILENENKENKNYVVELDINVNYETTVYGDEKTSADYAIMDFEDIAGISSFSDIIWKDWQNISRRELSPGEWNYTVEGNGTLVVSVQADNEENAVLSAYKELYKKLGTLAGYPFSKKVANISIANTKENGETEKAGVEPEDFCRG